MDEPTKNDQFNDDNSNPTSASAGNVMDIQPPKPAVGTTPSLPDASAAASLDTLETPTNVTTSSSDNNVADQTNSVKEPPSPATVNTGSDEAAAAAPVTASAAPDQKTEPDNNPLAIPPHTQQHSKGPGIAILVAIIVAVGLAALVVFTYSKDKNNTAGTNSNASPAPVSKPLASPEDIDSTTQQLETGLKQVDESKDFSSDELSDKSLGL